MSIHTEYVDLGHPFLSVAWESRGLVIGGDDVVVLDGTREQVETLLERIRHELDTTIDDVEVDDG